MKAAIQSRYGPASQREVLDLSIAYTSERLHDMNFVGADVHADQFAGLACLGGVDQPLIAFRIHDAFQNVRP